MRACLFLNFVLGKVLSKSDITNMLLAVSVVFKMSAISSYFLNFCCGQKLADVDS